MSSRRAAVSTVIRADKLCDAIQMSRVASFRFWRINIIISNIYRTLHIVLGENYIAIIIVIELSPSHTKRYQIACAPTFQTELRGNGWVCVVNECVWVSAHIWAPVLPLAAVKKVTCSHHLSWPRIVWEPRQVVAHKVLPPRTLKV